MYAQDRVKALLSSTLDHQTHTELLTSLINFHLRDAHQAYASVLPLYLHTNITVHTIVCTYTMTIHTYLFTSYESSLSIAERFTVQTSYYCMLTRLLW